MITIKQQKTECRNNREKNREENTKVLKKHHCTKTKEREKPHIEDLNKRNTNSTPNFIEYQFY